MRGFIKITLIFVTVMVLVGFGGWFGRKAYQKTTEHHLVSQARAYLAKDDIRNASLCLQRALQINPNNVETCRLTANVLESDGAGAAISWRIRAAELQTNNVQLRFDWAETALRLNDLPSAMQALRGVDTKYRDSASFHKLAGAIAWNYHAVADAEKEFTAALKLEPTNQVVTLNLATVQLLSTNRTVVDAARKTLEEVPASSPLHLTAIRYLAADAVIHKSYERALFFSKEVIADPHCTFGDQLGHLKLLHDANDSGYADWKQQVEKIGVQSPEKVLPLAHWLMAQDGASSALSWLQSLPPTLQTNLPVPLAFSDCEVALTNWNGVLAVTERQDWGDLNYYRLALASFAYHNLDQSRRFDLEWEKAMQLASHRLDRLTRLNQITTLWHWSVQRKQVLDTVVSQFPRETWAGEQLVAMLYDDGKTQAMADVLDRLSAANPGDGRLKNNLASVLMLLNTNLEKAHRLASESYGVAPNDPYVDCTYAYSLVLQSKLPEAAKVMDQMKGEYLKNPSIAAYYGVVEVMAGRKDAAREPLKLAASAHLLPEEQDLVRRAESKL